MIYEDNVTNHPLISVLLFCYNQEEFICQAISSLLDQDYPNLEVIISDDCSEDKTYEYICDFLESYQGPHKIIVRKTDSNLGIGRHVGELMSLANGEYFFLAAGDDISLLNRVSSVYSYWQEEGSECKAVFSNLVKIDKLGNELGVLFKKKPVFADRIDSFKAGLPCWAVGASLAIHRSLYDVYGSFHPDLNQEDGCLVFRALLNGRCSYFDHCTVLYRFHDNNVSQGLSIKQKIKFKSRENLLWKNWIKDALISRPADISLLRTLRRGYFVSTLTGWLVTRTLIGYPYFWMRGLAKRFLGKTKP